MAKTLKVGVVGMGHGRSHVRVFNEQIAESEVVIVCDLVEDYARAASEGLGIGRWTTSYDDLLSDPDIDLIAVCTSCHLHGRHTLAALDAGKHVMVEVPMVNDSLETLWKIVRMSERRNLKVQMDNQFRWMAHTREMKRLIEEGKLGEIFYVETEYVHNIEPILIRGDGSPTFRSGLGQVCQGTIDAGGGLYAVDTAYWLLGEQFIEAFCYGNRKNLPSRHVNDHEVALFKTHSGAIARVVCSKGPKRPVVEYQAVYGTQGTLETSGRLPHPPIGPGLYGCFGDEASHFGNYGWMYNISVTGSESANRKSTGEPTDGQAGDYDPWKDSEANPMKKLDVPPLSIPKDVAEKVGHGGVEVLAGLDLVQAILDDTQPPGNVYESARSCAAAICAVQSEREGRPVKIPEIFNRSDEVRKFHPLPYSHADSQTL
ncbi:MAG: Gfo/Idh/MocA family oxidoreductase [Planctomycetota bacterium]|jgi:predicted dehydrogenase|nr:Gfo/Idh/MocA family oxidoreductase [Planctomycetota bacterium]MDP7250626.1 Gfo/Idh/MocA family oxidoreductase [Planctomycetota bacterium]